MIDDQRWTAGDQQWDDGQTMTDPTMDDARPMMPRCTAHDQ